MPRKAITRSRDHYYHITARSNNRENFFLPTEIVWRLSIEKLEKLQRKFGIKVGAFVLMDNHFHLLVLTPNEEIDIVMYFLMKELTLDIQKFSGRINRIFGGRYKGSIITNYGYLMNVYKYIYRNPVEAGICKCVDDYVFSTLNLRNFSHHSLKLEPIITNLSFIDFQRVNELEWLNNKFKNAEAESIRTGLRKTIFAYGKDRNTGKVICPSFQD